MFATESLIVPSVSDDITGLLQAWAAGNPAGLERVIPLIYDDLRRMAAHYMGGVPAEHSLQPTALVHEVYLRFYGQDRVRWVNRGQFFAVAATMMRRVLLDAARRRLTDKRGAGKVVFDLDEFHDLSIERPESLVRLDDALAGLARVDAHKAHLVELRYFMGLSIADTARALDCSPDTVSRHWRVARAWLARELAGNR